jgi:ABC-type sugar transport system permease subunit
MGENKFLLPFAILLSFFILWGIVYTSRLNNKNIIEKENVQKIENEESDDIENLDNNLSHENLISDEINDFSMDGKDEIEEMMRKQTGSNENYKEPINSNQYNNLEEKINSCLLIENERYKNIINTRLNLRDITYVGDENFLEFWKRYEEEHEKEKAKCYQLYFE